MKFQTVKDRFIMAKWDEEPVVGVVKCLNKDGKGPFTFTFVNSYGSPNVQMFWKLDGKDRLTEIEVL